MRDQKYPSPVRVLLILFGGCSDVAHRFSVTGSEFEEIFLSLPQRRLVGAANIVWVAELNCVVFPEADGTDVVRSRRLFVQCFVPATRTSVFAFASHIILGFGEDVFVTAEEVAPKIWKPLSESLTIGVGDPPSDVNDNLQTYQRE